MPRSSRRRSKRSVKEGREYYSDTEEDTSSKGKGQEGRESGEKRKLVVKELSDHGNGYPSEEYVGSKKRKERSEKVGSDRWNGSGEVLGVESEIREESSQFGDKVLNTKGLVDLKSKVSGARHDGEMKEENVDLFVGKEEILIGKGESKRRERDVSEKEKLDRDFNRKDDYKLKDAREKEKGFEKDDRSMDHKRDLDYRAVDREEQRIKKRFESKGWSLEDEYEKHKPEKEGDRQRKKRIDESDDKDKCQDCDRDSSDVNVTSRRDRIKDETDRDERHKDITHRDKHYWPLDEVYGKHESEKERQTWRRKRTDESNDKDTYQEGIKDSSDINMTSRRERNKDGRDRDGRHKDVSSRDKNHDYYDRDSKSRYVDKREGKDRERRLKYDEYGDDRGSRDPVDSKHDSKYVRDEFDLLNGRHKKSRTDTGNFDSSVVYDGQSSRYKDNKDTRRSMDKQEYIDMKSRGAKEYLDSANKSVDAKEETVSELEKYISFQPDEFSAGQSWRKSSPSSTVLATRDQYRHSTQSDMKYRGALPEERVCSNLNYGKEGNGSGAYDRAHSSRSIDKTVQKVGSGHVGDLSFERHRVIDRRVSPAQLADKSLSPSCTERRHLSRIGDRRRLDYEDSGHRSSNYKDLNYQYHDGKRGQNRKVEAPSMDASSQVDGESMHGSSSFSRSVRIPGSSRSFLPPTSPLEHGVDNSYAGSAEEDGRGKLNNHTKRSVDSSMRRIQGNAWRGAPNWPSPMGNGYLPFPHGPAAVGFHPMMHQFPPQMFGVRPSMDHSGVPFHIPDGDIYPGYDRPFGWPNPVDETCPSPMPNWDSNNMVPGEGSTQGRVDWDRNRSLTGNASGEPSVDRYDGANCATMESPSGNRRATTDPNDDFSSQSNPGLKDEPFQYEHQVDKTGNETQLGSQLSSDMSAPVKEISGRISNAMLSEEGKKNVDTDDHVHRSCAYLSRIDISENLAPSDLFDHCISLLAIKLSTPDARTSRFSLKEENAVEGESAKINTYFSRVPVFTEVRGSLLEEAMSLYRQHRDDTAVNYSSSTSVGDNVHQSPEIEDSEPEPEPEPFSPASSQDQVLASSGAPNEFRASTSNYEDRDTNTAGDAAVKQETLGETDIDVDEAVTTCNARAKHEATRSVEDEAGSKETNEDNAAMEAANAGLPCTTNVHFEGSMMTELNECGLVNLSRIHLSPQSTLGDV